MQMTKLCVPCMKQYMPSHLLAEDATQLKSLSEEVRKEKGPALSEQDDELL